MGFTIIELIIVLGILGILATGLLMVMNPVTQLKKARDIQRKSGLREIKTSLNLYYNVFGSYPASDGDNLIKGCDGCPTPPCSCPWGEKWQRDNTVFMKQLAKEPLSSQSYSYTQDGNDNFYLIAALEIESDPGAEESQARCGVGSGSQYVVCAD